jgi:hypothetical protein
VSLALFAPSGCGSGGCTTVGCAPALTLKFQPSDLSVAQIQEASIKVCRNQECFKSSFASWKPGEPNTGTAIVFPNSEARDTLHTPIITAAFSRETSGFRLVVSYVPYSTDDSHNGDVYTVTLTGGDGSTLLEAQKTVNYIVSFPNGSPSCGECRTANIDL